MHASGAATDRSTDRLLQADEDGGGAALSSALLSSPRALAVAAAAAETPDGTTLNGTRPAQLANGIDCDDELNKFTAANDLVDIP